MTIHNKLSARALALVLTLILVLSLPGLAWAEAPVEQTNRCNVVLVVDKSGSLACENDQGTDPDGLRYEALKLFLGLLTESGNNVGTVVFDEHIRYESEVQPLEGMEAKQALIRTIEGYYPCYDTDIGKAMLRATELLRDMQQKEIEENSRPLPCMIILFSDGMTDFVTGDVLVRRRESFTKAQQALDAALENGITINGICLNVDETAERGKYEFQAYTYATGGEFEEVKQPEDLTAAFRRLYQIINGTEYTGAQRVAFSDAGEAEVRFAVPGFGVEEVNVIVEGEDLSDLNGGEETTIEIIRPDGERFDTTGHDLDSARCKLVKIPDLIPGIWTVRLKGAPENQADISMVCNATLNVDLMSEEVETYRTNMTYPFTAAVEAVFEDPDAPALTADQLGALHVTLRREELMTGAVREYPMVYKDGVYVIDDNGSDVVSFPRGGEYTLQALVDLGDFKKTSDMLNITAMPVPPEAQMSEVSDMLSVGRFLDDAWELELSELFSVGKGSEIEYSLSDDLGGLLHIDDDVLRLDLNENTRSGSFRLTATDQMEQSASVDFKLDVPAVTAKSGLVSDIAEQGSFHGLEWEIGLNELFEDPKGLPMTYEISDDYDGAIRIEGDKLHVQFEDSRPYIFALEATDRLRQSDRVNFDIAAPAVTAKIGLITDFMEQGSFHDPVWEIGLDELFEDPKGLPLTYALSNDYDGAVSMEDGMLRVQLPNEEPISFRLTATDQLQETAEIAFNLAVPTVTTKLSRINNILRLGKLEDFRWEVPLGGLFTDTGSLPLEYVLSDDCGGAVTLEDGLLKVDFHELREAKFDLTATNPIGRSAQIPFEIAVPAPTAEIGEITETVRTGLFQENIWQTGVISLFRDPKGTKLTYTLSDDLGGAAKMENDTLRVNMKGQKNAAFSIRATDEYGLSAEVPVTLAERNMTIFYVLIALAVLLIICIPIVIAIVRRRQSKAVY